MALRTQKTIAAFGLMTLLAGSCLGEEFTFAARHRHLRKGETGEIKITDSSISFREGGKHADHSREWKYEDIQQLWLSSYSLRILTYEDIRWKLGQDREYEFDGLPEKLSARLYSMLRQRMDQRFVAAMADSSFLPLWRGKAKHLTALGGSNGVVLISANAIVYEADAPGSSRTWRLQDIENVSTTGPFDLTISTFEREGSNYGSHRTFRFQLKEALPERTYNDLWRRLNPSHLSEQKENHPNE